ncbi:restriction endonuclease subunit S [Zobellia roscoffensis]|uniref:restriction endonuclease subunit S n=1 Tax=Zobellia roscoffensis TaxID=2779508 RepID=UPI00188AF3B1|nr:restriction endonuclease subunit S [Zobellia roscoffensis]
MRKDWEIVPFGEVCEISGGSQPPKSNFIYEPKEGYIRLVQVRDYRTDKYMTYVPINKAKKFCKKSDIMIGRYGPPIFGIFSGIEGAYNVALMKAIPNEEKLDKEYFRWFLKTDELVRFVEKTSKRAAGQDGVRKERLYSYPIPIPPIEEQKQIVALLDKAFTAIDQAKANISTNIANAKELFQSKLNDIFSQKGAGWEEKTLNEICEVKDGTHDSPKYVDEEFGIPFVTQKNILDDGISFEKTKFISEEDHNNFYRRSNVAYNDILFAMIGANRGMACLVDDKRVFSIKNVGLIKSNESYRAKFILYFLKSPKAKKYVAENSSGSAQGFIGLTKLRAFPIPFTSIENQKEIVLLIESLNNSIKTTIYNYSLKLNSLEELKKSILQKAFAGELTENVVVV